jgi:hypothetical protein
VDAHPPDPHRDGQSHRRWPAGHQPRS